MIMKRFKSSIQKIGFIGSIVLLAMACAFLTGCKGGDDPSPKDVNTKKLMTNIWKLNSVQVDAVDKTSLFTGMTLKFTATNYTTTNGGVVWPASGTWTFTDDTATKIKRNDDLVVTIFEITDTSLKLSLSWASGTYGPGRVSSVAGIHTFNFVKQ
jgi:hypothetical protein